MNETIELDRYFERIGYPGPRTPTLNVLHALTAAHSQAIPFENIDVLLGRPIRLEPQALQQKILRRGLGQVVGDLAPDFRGVGQLQGDPHLLWCCNEEARFHHAITPSCLTNSSTRSPKVWIS